MIGEKLGHSEEYIDRCFIKIVGEDSYLVGNYRMIDYESIRDRVSVGEIPKLVILDAESNPDLIHASETVYLSLDQEVCTLSKDIYAKNHSLTALSLNTLGLPLKAEPVSIFNVNRMFTIHIDTIQ